MSRIDHQITYSRLRLSMYSQGRTIRKGRERGRKAAWLACPVIRLASRFGTPTLQRTITRFRSWVMVLVFVSVHFISFHLLVLLMGRCTTPATSASIHCEFYIYCQLRMRIILVGGPWLNLNSWFLLDTINVPEWTQWWQKLWQRYWRQQQSKPR